MRQVSCVVLSDIFFIIIPSQELGMIVFPLSTFFTS